MPRAFTALAAGLLPTAAALGVAGCGLTPSTSTTPNAPSLPEAATDPIPPLLQSTWAGYRQRFIQGDGRVLDPQRDDATTSEGQSYALLRAAWMDDRDTFARVWRWTHDNLATADGLFGYLWGRRPDGSWGTLSANSATDADQDIALALLLAARRWGQSGDNDAAAAVVRAIWAHEVTEVAGRPYLVAGSWAATTSPGPTINPSYFAPYAYRLFATLDGAHPWRDVVDTSYQALDACTAAPLSIGRSAGLPPNWCVLDSQGRPHPAASMQAADDYGYDAFRVMWRLAVDARWNGEPRARDYLERNGFLRTAWQRDGRLASVYRHDGGVVAGNEDVAVYGGDLGNLLVTDAAAAEQLLHSKLLPSLGHHDGVAYWGEPDNYYQQNWAWFGLALAAGRVTPPQV